MDLDIFLLVFVLVALLGGVYVSIRILLYYQDPADSGIGSNVFVKAVVVSSLTLCWLLNILLPVDVRNSRPVPGLLDMSAIWTAAFATLFFFIFIVIPAAMFYHEADGDVVMGKKVKRHVLCNMFFMLFFVGGALGISYAFLAEAAIPVRQYKCDNWLGADEVLNAAAVGAKACVEASDSSINFKVGFQVYMVAFMCFIGWFFFVTFGGIGLSALPIDLILEFVDRPRPIDEVTFQQERREIGRISQELLSTAAALQERDSNLATESGWKARRAKARLSADYNKWKKEVMFLEDDYDRNQISKHEKGESIAVSIVKLIMGILFAIMSLMWILHTILYVLVRQYAPFMPTFLNALFEAFEGPGLYPVGVALFGTFSLYLLLCVIKGCLKFGMRIFICFAIHPMKMKATPLNSILFNVLMVLVSSPTVVQFTQEAFSDYARLTDADVIFAAQIKYLKFYSLFFENNVFIYALLGWFLLTLIFLLVRGPRDHEGRRSKNNKRDKKGKKDKKGKDSKEKKKGSS